jgi:uncharacterized membrane-anchored protein
MFATLSRSAGIAGRSLATFGVLLMWVNFAGAPAVADVLPAQPPLSTHSDALTPFQQYLMKDATLGPAQIRLRDQAVLSLPAMSAFLPEAPAKAMMKRLGNDTDANFLGIILPWNQSNWFITLDYIPAGHVADDDAKNWNADDLLKSVRESTEAANAERKKQGVPELDILGWVEKPHYDQAAHRLIWSISAKQKGAEATGANIINYKMLALGREGYISLVMVTDMDSIAARKPIANQMLSQIGFNSGKRYGDFNSSTDHVAEYGLAALIGGVVVHKLGFFALIAAFLVKGAKLIAVLALGAVAAVRRFFTGKKAPDIRAATPQPAMEPPPAVPAPPVEPPQ